MRRRPIVDVAAVVRKATVRGVDQGEMRPAPEQARLRDFAIPQWGMFVVGRAMFTNAGM
jgi:hypothetical protein